jgi:hypothetical protein
LADVDTTEERIRAALATLGRGSTLDVATAAKLGRLPTSQALHALWREGAVTYHPVFGWKLAPSVTPSSAPTLPELWEPQSTSRFARRLSDAELIELVAKDAGWHGPVTMVADKVTFEYGAGALRAHFNDRLTHVAYGETEELARENLTSVLVDSLRAVFQGCLALAGPKPVREADDVPVSPVGGPIGPNEG